VGLGSAALVGPGTYPAAQGVSTTGEFGEGLLRRLGGAAEQLAAVRRVARGGDGIKQVVTSFAVRAGKVGLFPGSLVLLFLLGLEAFFEPGRALGEASGVMAEADEHHLEVAGPAEGAADLFHCLAGGLGGAARERIPQELQGRAEATGSDAEVVNVLALALLAGVGNEAAEGLTEIADVGAQ
jgi:hypothetical protein